MVAKKKGKMTKRPNSLVTLPGCMSCGKAACKYNGPIADPVTASHFDYEDAYGCNTRFQGLTLEGAVNGRS